VNVLPSRAGAASADALDMRIQPIIPPCFTSCFRDARCRPLLVAIQHGHVEAVKMLIANGASTGGVYDVSSPDVPSPLILAIRTGRRDIIAILLEHAASVDERECEDMLEYPLHAAVRSQDFEILKTLLKTGPKIDCLAWW
jgi:ankyrin repeat protein